MEFEIIDYSEKAIAVFGNTQAIKEDLIALGGRFNPNLTVNGERRAGWIFSVKNEVRWKSYVIQLQTLLHRIIHQTIILQSPRIIWNFTLL